MGTAVESKLNYYRKHSYRAVLAFFMAAMREKSRLRRLALLNRQRDYIRLASQPKLFQLHGEFQAVLEAAGHSWESYDYGEGYFYQGLAALGVTGFRDTDARVEATNLRSRVKGSSVLEIGCNTGFASAAIADSASRVVGFDLNPHLVQIARMTAEFLGHSNCEFKAVSFEDFESPEPFDTVLSFANHSTYDRNTRHSLASYFEKCRALTKPGGQLLFESHPPQHEGAGLEDVVQIIAQLFQTQERSVLNYGTFLDRGRTFIVARRR